MSHHTPDPKKSVNLTINGIAVTVPEDTRILEAARKAHVSIPTLCEHPDLCKRAVCRLCVVECDGRGKLLAACANDVWEGVNVVTHNDRLASIRKTILELILANHPQDCLNCIRSKNCELQKLAADFGIRETPFHAEAVADKPAANDKLPSIENEVLVRDMSKCVKCGRCVEACQEVQTIKSINTSHRSIHYEISAPYGKSLAEGSCVFCGQCASVCPVGAIYEYDQTDKAWAAINDKECNVVAQVSPDCAAAFDKSFDLPAGTVTPGKMVSALRRLGFDKVFDTSVSANATTAAENNELAKRQKSCGKLPMICGCSAGCDKFVNDSYPDLSGHLSSVALPSQMFATMAGAAAKTTAVSISPCIAQKYLPQNSAPDVNLLVLTVNEIARMCKLIGIDFASLPETPFDVMGGVPSKAATPATVKTLTAHGFAEARTILDSIRKGECKADVVFIKSCPDNK